MTLPNFFIVGAAKAGTTSLHYYLSQHPQVYMSKNKDTSFFAHENKILDWTGPKISSLSSRVITTFPEYEKQFDNVKNEVAIGESSPIYLHSKNAISGISHYIKSPKIIIVLRHPVERAYAHYMHGLRDNMEPEKSFEAALNAEEERKAKNWGDFWYYKERSMYHDAIKSYYDAFGKENIAVYLFDDMKSSTSLLVKDIFKFLNVDPDFTPQVSIEHNVSGIPKNRFIHDLFSMESFLTKIAKKTVPADIRAFVRTSIMKRNLRKKRLETEVRQRVIEFFRDDIMKTQKLINRDLTHWL
jgi:hypothetical protein